MAAAGSDRYSRAVARANQAGKLTPASARPSPDIGRLIEAWALAWNAHDMRAAAALVAEDVDFVTVAGLWLKGRGEFLRHHDHVHRRHLRGTAWTTLATAVRPLADDLVLAHLEWTITGELDPRGATLPPRSGIFTWVIASTVGPGHIVAAHNTNLRPDTAHRLAGRRAP
jgi:uncharacterized protein (TIGR02246 family)